MSKCKFKVRALLTDGSEHVVENLSYSEAVEKFLFYVHCALELDLRLSCCNIIIGKKTIKMFVNHGYK